MKYGTVGSLSNKIKFIRSNTWKLSDAIDIAAVIRRGTARGRDRNTRKRGAGK